MPFRTTLPIALRPRTRRRDRLHWLQALCAGLLGSAALVANAADEAAVAQEDASNRWQSTYNWQRHPAFRQAYAGPYSLTADHDTMYTLSLTAHLGLRPWQNGELYFNPELTQGVPFTRSLVGLGGFTNGEITRAGGSNPKLYRQRLFLRQTFNRGGGSEAVDGDLNQMAGTVDRNRVVVTAGNFSTLDVFDGNAYAKDPRTQFMNWGHWTYAAYDYAADARGFGWGAAIEIIQGDWALRLGRMSGPQEPNGLPVDLSLLKHYGDQIELERGYRWGDWPGRIRVLAWHNRARLARFADALRWQQDHPGNHDSPIALLAVRGGEKNKSGIGVNLEQAIGRDAGVFLRAMQADGRTETHAFTETDASVALGLSVKGSSWGRGHDTVGMAASRNMLSADRRRFLEAGGTSFFIGDGGLRYRPETIAEAYYSLRVLQDAWFTADVQRIWNPAYNADRGPVLVFAARLHAEF
jgi:hypothetical protein